MSSAMSLKTKIRNIAKQKNIPAQVILQNYMFERLLIRLAGSICILKTSVFSQNLVFLLTLTKNKPIMMSDN